MQWIEVRYMRREGALCCILYCDVELYCCIGCIAMYCDVLLHCPTLGAGHRDVAVLDSIQQYSTNPIQPALQQCSTGNTGMTHAGDIGHCHTGVWMGYSA